MHSEHSLLLPFRSFPEHEYIPDPRLAREYSLFVREYPLYRKVAASPHALPLAMAYYFVENLLARQGSNGYS
jgi:hypothetical protein